MDSGYSANAIAWAVLGAVVFPLIALAAALVLLDSRTDPRKRKQLRLWAWGSGAWLVVASVGSFLLATY